MFQYYNQFDEWGRLDREPIEFQVNMHYIKKYLPISGEILDNGAGPGKYAMELAKEGYRMTLTDLIPKFVEMAESNAGKLGIKEKFNGFYVQDARKLYDIRDEQFDASLMLGPMYHLQEESDRIMAVKELNRVVKKDGIVFVAFMSRIRHILSSLINPENWKPLDNMDAINQFAQTGCFNHKEEGRFTGAHYIDIEEIKPFMSAHGFECIDLIGSNIGAILSEENWNYWKSKGATEVNKVINLLMERASDPNTLGISSHLLYIGRKLK
ncbi:class I SAM-dependent methyltransferase [Niallia sp. 03133]|uniref:class I SAM-dependent methyltransferase n=1 Tax=Niallia sp. 03133 TaxID=3458060 RepID=UPI00404435DD